eukprot:TRINITY_DN4588_c0_g1_i3.p1 TRINITY_DN4588_c0_g1~~TRINITY_DN4588_c0_g1_i3.p1  ORF type:complete len:576 (-),score=121.34 TRINITY_DN4588_c0_g1_i3:603-2330(-)
MYHSFSVPRIRRDYKWHADGINQNADIQQGDTLEMNAANREKQSSSLQEKPETLDSKTKAPLNSQGIPSSMMDSMHIFHESPHGRSSKPRGGKTPNGSKPRAAVGEIVFTTWGQPSQRSSTTTTPSLSQPSITTATESSATQETSPANPRLKSKSKPSPQSEAVYMAASSDHVVQSQTGPAKAFPTSTVAIPLQKEWSSEERSHLDTLIYAHKAEMAATHSYNMKANSGDKAGSEAHKGDIESNRFQAPPIKRKQSGMKVVQTEEIPASKQYRVDSDVGDLLPGSQMPIDWNYVSKGLKSLGINRSAEECANLWRDLDGSRKGYVGSGYPGAYTPISSLMESIDGKKQKRKRIDSQPDGKPTASFEYYQPAQNQYGAIVQNDTSNTSDLPYAADAGLVQELRKANHLLEQLVKLKEEEMALRNQVLQQFLSNSHPSQAHEAMRQALLDHGSVDIVQGTRPMVDVLRIVDFSLRNSHGGNHRNTNSKSNSNSNSNANTNTNTNTNTNANGHENGGSNIKSSRQARGGNTNDNLLTSSIVDSAAPPPESETSTIRHFTFDTPKSLGRAANRKHKKQT